MKYWFLFCKPDFNCVEQSMQFDNFLEFPLLWGRGLWYDLFLHYLNYYYHADLDCVFPAWNMNKPVLRGLFLTWTGILNQIILYLILITENSCFLQLSKSSFHAFWFSLLKLISMMKMLQGFQSNPGWLWKNKMFRWTDLSWI